MARQARDSLNEPERAPEGGAMGVEEGLRVLSAFVDLSPRHVRGEQHRIGLRTRLAAARGGLPDDERPRFDRAAAWAEEHLESSGPQVLGLAIYVADPPRFREVIPLPAPPQESVHWGDYPYLTPWLAAIDEHERFAIALVDKERARLLSVLLGRVESGQSITDEVPGKQETGDWFALAQTRYERHHLEHVRRHMDRVIAALQRMNRRAPFRRLVIGGPPEAVQLLEQMLPARLRERVVGKVSSELFERDEQLLADAAPLVEGAERREEEALVDEAMTRTAKGRAAVTGGEAVLAALDAGRVHRLLIMEEYELREDAVAKALEAGAVVEFVRGGARDKLAAAGGIAALLRY